MLDDRGFVATCNSTHFFIVRKGEVWTSAGGYCLGGITRGAVLRAARREGIPAFEKDFSLFDVYGADEAFTTGTFAGLVPVAAVDGRGIGDPPGAVDDRSGPMTGRLRAAVKALEAERPRGGAIERRKGRADRDVVRAAQHLDGNDAFVRRESRLRGHGRAVVRRLSCRHWPRPPDARRGDEVVASQPTDWRTVAAELVGPPPEGKRIWYQKHMTHHMLPHFGREWTEGLVNAFLIRVPEAVLASYALKRDDFTLEEIGLPAQAELFDRAADRLGRAPPVVEAQDVLADPQRTLFTLCAALEIPFDPAMLSWPPGRRATDGVWAPVWYQTVDLSTGFSAPRQEVRFEELPDVLKPIAAAARPIYDRLAAHRLKPADH